MKKILTFLVLLLFPMVIYAEDVTVFSINEITASAGNNVTVKLNMDNKQEFGVLTARVHYDSSKLEYVSSEVKGLKSVLRGTENNADKSMVILYAINLSGTNLMKDNGNILIMEFKIKDNVTEDIPLEIEIKDFGIDEETPLKYETQNGLIKIKKDVESVNKDKTDDLQEEFNEAIKSSDKKNDEITWTTSDESIATVDENGKVTFNKNGNVVVEAKDSQGNVVYSKEYYVNDKVHKKYPIIIAISGVLLILIISLIILRRKKCKKGK